MASTSFSSKSYSIQIWAESLKVWEITFNEGEPKFCYTICQVSKRNAAKDGKKILSHRIESIHKVVSERELDPAVSIRGRYVRASSGFCQLGKFELV
jgi:hypothetical protein